MTDQHVPATSAAIRAVRSGTFALPVSRESAFALFTPEGERHWVPDWDPVLLGSAPQGEGLVFLTGAGEEATIWTVLVSDQRRGELFYSRVTPRKRAGTVRVLVREGQSPREALVTVSYDLTALPWADANCLDAYGETAFHEMLLKWRTLIMHYVAAPQAQVESAE